MTRIVFSSNAPWANTGYATETKGIVRGIRDLGYPIAILAWWGLQGGDTIWEGVPCFPVQIDPYGNDAAAHVCKRFKADVLITLIDLWVMDPALGHIGNVRWCVPGHTEITLASGIRRTIKEIVEDALPIDVLGWQDGKAVPATIEARHTIDANLSGEIIEVQTESGQRLEVTADNLVAVENHGQLEWLSADCLRPGMMVYCTHSIPRKDQQNDASADADGQVPPPLDAPGMGLFGGGHRWGGNHLHLEGQESGQKRIKPPRSDTLHHSAYTDNLQYAQRLATLACSEDRDSRKWAITTTNDWTKSPQASTKGVLPSTAMGISGLPCCATSSALSDHQIRAGEVGNGIYRESIADSGESLQCALFGTRAATLASSSGLEPQRIVAVSSRGKPYRVVYDLTTSTGNFVAGGMLIHNCPLFPIDHADPIPPAIAERFPHAHQLLVYSHYAEREVKAYASGQFASKVRYLPHGIDTTALTPPVSPDEKRFFRRKWYGDWPENAFIVGMVAANKGYPCRKSFPEAMEAFAGFAAVCPEARMYLHSIPTPIMQGPDLQQMAVHFGIADKVRFANPQYLMGGDFADEQMREVYGSLDVLLSPSQGEGFGLPIVEAQSCGTPVVVTDHSAMSELVGDGWRVKPARLMPSLAGGKFAEADVGGIRHALEECYRRPRSPLFGVVARQFAERYSWPRVLKDYWAPWLAEMDGGRREMALELAGVA